ncbi:5-formyltetrahydrofolate cyclo-ligase [Clostridium ljungdahlii]|uniref:5-formyltetrahydrofolate cyclo-ligase n=1 Tax=Clostridium ljungdahlii TaxID=1538 RepID=A0A166SFH5_9CLOT|nr:5-formyltetrahydrofolate cyclo-ligase [Clostridium ljungdahlii]OAA92120.1 putative 5-formyltetrahydrofolate cyclo-ligase [Clostridium ljungdahlii]
MDKSIIRKKMKEERNKLSNLQKEKLDNSVLQKVIESEEYNKANSIFIFVSYGSEVDTHRIIKKALKQGKNIYVPKVISKEDGMIAVRIHDFSELKSGAYGILEPEDTKSKVEESSIDLCYIPGVAFDKRGGRVGYGGGYYDRFFKKLREDSQKIALAYRFQVLDEVPMEEHDMFIDGIISD